MSLESIASTIVRYRESLGHSAFPHAPFKLSNKQRKMCDLFQFASLKVADGDVLVDILVANLFAHY